LKERYALVQSSESWMNWTFDTSVTQLKSINLDLLFNDFKGLLFGTTTSKIKKYPIRYSTVNINDPNGNLLYAAGTPIPPEVYDTTDNKWKPNPYWTSLIASPYEINWILGDSFCKTIKVGPPPKEFSAKNMNADKFYSMKWNGEVHLTDQILITNSDGSISLNSYGENLQFQSKLTHGLLMGERRNAFPILTKRQRPPVLSA
jgi:hypothetical protein